MAAAGGLLVLAMAFVGAVPANAAVRPYHYSSRNFLISSRVFCAVSRAGWPWQP
jgi:hypothetical protein